MNTTETLSEYLGRYISHTSTLLQDLDDKVDDFSSRLTPKYRDAMLGFEPVDWNDYVRQLRRCEQVIGLTSSDARTTAGGSRSNDTNNGYGRGNFGQQGSRGGGGRMGRGREGHGDFGYTAGGKPYNPNAVALYGRNWRQIQGLKAMNRCSSASVWATLHMPLTRLVQINSSCAISTIFLSCETLLSPLAEAVAAVEDRQPTIMVDGITTTVMASTGEVTATTVVAVDTITPPPTLLMSPLNNNSNRNRVRSLTMSVSRIWEMLNL